MTNISNSSVYTPWIVRNQSVINYGQVLQNPTPSASGLVGASTLPYIVPTGKMLQIDYLAFESHEGVAFWLWTGSTMLTQNQIMTFTSIDAKYNQGSLSDARFKTTQEWRPQNVFFDEGVQVNLALQEFSPTFDGFTFGWLMSGKLFDK